MRAHDQGGGTRLHGGTGLGLAISRRLAQAMAGEVGATSRPGVGSVFWFELTLPAAPPAATMAHTPAPGFDGQRVLVVEDNAVNQEITRAGAGPRRQHRPRRRRRPAR